MEFRDVAFPVLEGGDRDGNVRSDSQSDTAHRTALGLFWWHRAHHNFLDHPRTKTLEKNQHVTWPCPKKEYSNRSKVKEVVVVVEEKERNSVDRMVLEEDGHVGGNRKEKTTRYGSGANDGK